MTDFELYEYSENKLKEAKKRIADLEEENKHIYARMTRIDKVLDEKIARIAELEKENTELRKEWQEQVQKATDEGYTRTLQTIQLTKAKEIIKKLISDNRKAWVYSDVREEAEQFLSEVEK